MDKSCTNTESIGVSNDKNNNDVQEKVEEKK